MNDSQPAEDLFISEWQARVDDQIQAFGGYWDAFQILARLMEELGEVAAALQRLNGLRPHDSTVDLEAEIGDVLYTVMAFANARQIRLDQALARVLQKYEQRDQQAWQDQQRDR